MANHTLMTEEEKDKLMALYRKLEQDGRHEEATNIRIQIPIAPFLAMAAKEVFGADWVKNSGYNLSEAEAKYGKDWLNQ